MTTVEFLAGTLQGNLGLLQRTLADFAPADYLVRPVPGANHTAWQLGHLVCSETGMLSACGAKMPALPPGFTDRFNKSTAAADDPAAFGTGAELLALLAGVRAATVAYVRSLSDADLSEPAPEKMRSWMPTVGDLLNIVGGHVVMHLGQMQVVRRKLGKPVLF
jgi:hypothetical protein